MKEHRDQALKIVSEWEKRSLKYGGERRAKELGLLRIFIEGEVSDRWFTNNAKEARRILGTLDSKFADVYHYLSPIILRYEYKQKEIIDNKESEGDLSKAVTSAYLCLTKVNDILEYKAWKGEVFTDEEKNILKEFAETEDLLFSKIDEFIHRNKKESNIDENFKSLEYGQKRIREENSWILKRLDEIKRYVD